MPLYTTPEQFTTGCEKALTLLEAHYLAFTTALPLANQTGHTVPSDTKSWSQILVSVVTGLNGRKREKGSDLEDGSDVKAANVWDAIDTPRFNGCLPAGRTTEKARKPNDVSALDETPFLFFVLWDTKPDASLPRCRMWAVRPNCDPEYRGLAERWYADYESGRVRSNNCQLQPPRNLNSDLVYNSWGRLEFPLFFSAVRRQERWELEFFSAEALTSGTCRRS